MPLGRALAVPHSRESSDRQGELTLRDTVFFKAFLLSLARRPIALLPSLLQARRRRLRYLVARTYSVSVAIAAASANLLVPVLLLSP